MDGMGPASHRVSDPLTLRRHVAAVPARSAAMREQLRRAAETIEAARVLLAASRARLRLTAPAQRMSGETACAAGERLSSPATRD